MERIIVRVPAISFDLTLTYIVVEMVNRPGVLAGVLNTLAGLGVNVLEGVHSRGEREDQGAWIALIKMPRGLTGYRVEKAVKGVDGVLKVRVGARRYGKMLLPPVELVWEVAPGMPVSIWRHMFLSKVYEGLTRAMGAPGHAVFFHQGREAGMLIYDFWCSAMDTRDPRVLLEGAFHVLQRLGWFTHAEIRELDPERGVVTLAVKNSVVAYGRRSDRPLCYFLAGLFSGYASKVLGREVKIVEVRCQARGDPYCIFTSRQR